MPVKDHNGVEIKVGMRAVSMSPGMNNGKIGTVRAIVGKCPALRNKSGVRVSDGPEALLYWSSWLLPKDVAVLP